MAPGRRPGLQIVPEAVAARAIRREEQRRAVERAAITSIAPITSPSPRALAAASAIGRSALASVAPLSNRIEPACATRRADRRHLLLPLRPRPVLRHRRRGRRLIVAVVGHQVFQQRVAVRESWCPSRPSCRVPYSRWPCESRCEWTSRRLWHGGRRAPLPSGRGRAWPGRPPAPAMPRRQSESAVLMRFSPRSRPRGRWRSTGTPTGSTATRWAARGRPYRWRAT